jgi:sulfatase maturation enzyme AslB (radical SAM superfamily)
MSKGSKQRPTKKPEFDKNYDNINWDKKHKRKIVTHAEVAEENIQRIKQIFKDKS